MIRTYGPDALVKLIRSYADGRTDDEAFSAALGLDMTAFGDAWFKDVKATPKAKSGPQPAPPGPVPSAWTGAAPGSQASGAPASPGTGAAATGAPAASAVPGSSGSTGGNGGTMIGLLVAVGVIFIIVGVALAARRRRASEAAQ